MKFYGRYVMLMYVICIGTVIVTWNWLEGNVIQDWNATGEGKLRVGREFATFVFLFGNWVYILAPASAVLFLWQAFEEKTSKAKIACLLRAITAILFFVWFAILGVAQFIQKI